MTCIRLADCWMSRRSLSSGFWVAMPAGQLLLWQIRAATQPIVGDAVRAGDLDIILPAYQPPKINIYAVYASRKRLSAKVRTFIDFAVAQIGEQPAWDLGF